MMEDGRGRRVVTGKKHRDVEDDAGGVGWLLHGDDGRRRTDR